MRWLNLLVVGLVILSVGCGRVAPSSVRNLTGSASRLAQPHARSGAQRTAPLKVPGSKARNERNNSFNRWVDRLNDLPVDQFFDDGSGHEDD